ncbi:MAG: zinc ABC transporter substrate-binding protein [Nocardioidaceae bacterium]
MVGLALLAGLAAGCADSPTGDVPGKVDVVATTDVWGSIAAAVGGPRVSVISVINDPDQDPHSYEASSRTLLAVKEADLLIENGGGYDDFMGRMISTAGNDAPVLDAVMVSGLTAPTGGELNEHIWYDFAAVTRVAEAIATKLGGLDPDHASEFAANAKTFVAGVDRLTKAERQLGAAHEGAGIAITEPVPLYMLEAMHVHNLTPAEFSAAVEEGRDVSPRVLADTLALFSEHRVELLVYNAQTSGPVTEQVKAAAVSAGIPVVPVSETLPPGTTYLAWMAHNVARVREALSQR